MTRKSAAASSAADYGDSIDVHETLDAGAQHSSHDNDVAASTMNNLQPNLDDICNHPMFQFGHGYPIKSFGPNGFVFPAASLPRFDFMMRVDPPDEDCFNGQDMLTSTIADELYQEGHIFNGFAHPFMHEDVADDNGVLHYVSPDSEGLHVPVYPRQAYVHVKDATFTFNGPQHNNQNDFPTSTTPNPKPVATPVTGRRPLLPKHDRGHGRAPPDAVEVIEPSNAKGRKRPLSPDARAQVRQVRLIHACARCRKKREKCGTERPCKPCRSDRRRKLDFPCMKEFPEDRHIHLFTEEMYGHLEIRSNDLLKNMPKANPQICGGPFTIRLHQYFDDPELTIPVVEFVPEAGHETIKSVFPIERNGNKYEVQHRGILSPPLVPALSNKDFPEFSAKFYWSVRRWMDCAEMYDDLEWHKTFFREEYGKAWPREVLGTVCQFYHKVLEGGVGEGCPVLKSCLQSTVLVYMIGHTFYIPREDVQGVLARTRFGAGFAQDPPAFVSPVHVDRFLKVLLYPILRACVKTSLKQFQMLYAPNALTELTRDRVLAISIVLLIVAASQQSKAVEQWLARARQGRKIDQEVVVDSIREIEKELIDLVLELWVYKFSSGAKVGRGHEPDYRRTAKKAKEFNIMERFRSSYYDNAKDLQDLPTELTNINESTFGATNIDRVLQKFWLCVFDNKKQEKADCE